MLFENILYLTKKIKCPIVLNPTNKYATNRSSGVYLNTSKIINDKMIMNVIAIFFFLINLKSFKHPQKNVDLITGSLI